MSGHFLILYNRECRINVPNIVPLRNAIEMKIDCIELGAELSTTIFVPCKGRLHLAISVAISHVAGERSHVMRSVSQL